MTPWSFCSPKHPMPDAVSSGCVRWEMYPMRLLSAPWLATLRATISLLYDSHPRAFLVSAVASRAEPLFFPAFILLLQRLLQNITTGGTVHVTPVVVQLGIAVLALLLVQRLGIIVRDASSTILRQEAWVAISKQVMQKLPAVSYPLFEN